MRKKLVTLLTAAILHLSGIATAQTLSVQPIEVQTGEQTEVVVSLTGGTAMTALQFNLTLPDGVTLGENDDNYGATLGTATNGHTLCVEPLASSDYLFVLYSLDLKPFRDGELLRLPVTFANNAKSATGQLNTIRMADADAVSYIVANTNITTGIGDEVKEKGEEGKSGAGANNPPTGGVRGAFDLSGQQRSSLQRGVNIVRSADGSVRKIVKRQ